MSRKNLARWSAAAAAATFVASLAVGTAAARPDPGSPIPDRYSSYYDNCPLQRIGTQLVRCDDLTGGGVTAPLSVPEQ
jgi:hypothetical protein